jgi:hypothetical protein
MMSCLGVRSTFTTQYFQNRALKGEKFKVFETVLEYACVSRPFILKVSHNQY